MISNDASRSSGGRSGPSPKERRATGQLASCACPSAHPRLWTPSLPSDYIKPRQSLLWLGSFCTARQAAVSSSHLYRTITNITSRRVVLFLRREIEATSQNHRRNNAADRTYLNCSRCRRSPRWTLVGRLAVIRFITIALITSLRSQIHPAYQPTLPLLSHRRRSHLRPSTHLPQCSITHPSQPLARRATHSPHSIIAIYRSKGHQNEGYFRHLWWCFFIDEEYG